MWVVLEKRNFAILTLSGGQQVHLRKGQPYEITQQEWDLQLPQFKSLFEVRDADGDPLPEGGSGEPGAPGLSAYEIAVANGFAGTEEEWLDSLKAEAGEYEVGYVENASGVAQAINTATALVNGMTLEVPATDRPLWVNFGAAITCSAAPAVDTSSYVSLLVALTPTFDTPTVVGVDQALYAGTTGQIPTLTGIGRVGPSDVARTLYMGVFRGGNANFRASLLHGTTVYGWKTWMGAFVR